MSDAAGAPAGGPVQQRLRPRSRRLRRLLLGGLVVALVAELVLQLARPVILDNVRQRTLPWAGKDADFITLQSINFDPASGLPLVVYDPDAFWVLAPDRRGSWFLTDDVRTNALGLRGPPLPARAEEGEVRLLFVGDWVTFGMRVAEDDVFASRLAQRLRDERPGPAWTAVNAGVIGYAATQVLERLPDWLDATRPDVVCCGLGLNDCLLLPASDAQFLERTTSIAARMRHAARQSQLVCGLEAGWASLRRAADEWTTARRRSVVRWIHYPRLPSGDVRVPRTAEPEFFAILERIERLCAGRGVPLVLVTGYASPEVPSVRTPDAGYFERLGRLADAVRGFGAARGLPVADARAALERSPLARSELMLDFCHPSPAGHALIADELHRTLDEAGLLDRWRARTEGR